MWLHALVTLVASATAAPASARDTLSARRSAEVDKLFAKWHAPDSPGASVLVLHQGRVVHLAGYGMASLEHGVPNRPHTVFDIASVSKQFGAFAIALLEADGRLTLDDDVRKYLPELPDFGTVITIRHLVHHTTGLRDWPGTLRLGGWGFDDVISFEQILRMAYRQTTLNFKPGDEHAYSNTGYNLLAEVVRRISGKTFRQFTDERIFRPLGMTRTHFHDDHREVVRDVAESYAPAGDGGYQHLTSNLTALGSSSLFTTVEDLAKWVGNFETAAVGGRAAVDGMHRRGVLNRGDTIAYAFGQSEGNYRGAKTYSHGGSWAGYRSVLTRFPAERFAVVILANAADMNPGALGQRIADLYLGDRLGPVTAAQPPAPQPAAAAWRPDEATLREYAGEYRTDELDTSWRLDVRRGELVASHFRVGEVVLGPVAKDSFRAPGLGGDLTFQRDRRGRLTGFVSNSVRIRHFLFRRVEPR